ncbi:MAG: YceI family protein [Armatimonadetes bacterium]|nr:YceI family protein [Armatimonadota bacterium]
MTVQPRSTIARRFFATILVSLAGIILTIAMLQAPQGISVVGAGPAVERFTIVPGEWTASYDVQETFLRNMQFNVAVGTTRDVRGEIAFDRANPRNTRIGTITIDVNKLQSDNGTRDNFIRRNTLETEKFPTAEFTPTEILGLPETVAAGREVAASIRGNLRIKDATGLATFAATPRQV